MSNNTEPRILEYDSVRLFGMGRVVKTSEDCKNLWADAHGFMQQMGATQPPYYALCRCAAGAEAGAFEYVAAAAAPGDAPVPKGMMEIMLPAGTYAEFPVAGLSDIGRVWGYTGEWLAAHPEWKGFCDGNPDRCGCVDHPAFEFYPPEFDGSNGLFIRIPLRAA